jgi:uncharacterized membrane protein YfcA
MIHDWHFYLMAVPAVILVGFSKGGFQGMGLLSLPLLTLVIPPLQATAIMLPILMVQDCVTLWSFRKTWDKRNLLIFLAGGLVGIFVAAAFAARLSNAAVELAVGLISVGFVLNAWFGPKPAADAKPSTPPLGRGLFWAFCSGVTSFIANAGAPPFQIYVMPQKLSPVVYAGTAALFFGVANSTKFVVLAALGQVSRDNLATSSVLFPLALASAWGGTWLVRRVRADAFYTIIYWLTLFVGTKLIFDGARSLLTPG